MTFKTGFYIEASRVSANDLLKWDLLIRNGEVVFIPGVNVGQIGPLGSGDRSERPSEMDPYSLKHWSVPLRARARNRNPFWT